MPHIEKGLIHVYTGDGKGKTTASLGLAFRAAGHGFRVFMIQFMKGIENRDYGELKFSQTFHNLTMVQFGTGFVGKKPSEFDILSARKGMECAKKAINSGKYDIVILDEINVAINYGLVPLEEVIELIEKKPNGVELILTGRNAPEEIIERSDYVTEMRLIKHPYDRGIGARVGIEF
ncbi:MAG: cob(I)yrinic acid a,c-diamide adenosyltransferase [Candidatus Syntropharchaeia archaeon]